MMKRLLAIVALLSALLSAVPLFRPRSAGRQALIWLPKLLGGALAPISGLIGALAALVGLVHRDWALAGTGLLGAGLAARLVTSVPDVDQELAGLPAPGGEGSRPSGQGETARAPDPARRPCCAASPEFERDVVVGRKAESGRELLADLWPPAHPQPSGLGLIYAHGSAWRVGDKDLLTRPFFRRLAARGHLVLDIAYSLWPTAGLPAMVAEVNQAILWLKEKGPAYGVNPDRIVLMGGSAGGHLALMAAYTPGHPAFRPAGADGDTGVRGVVAFYPPTDLLALGELADGAAASSEGALDRLGLDMARWLLSIRNEAARQSQSFNLLSEMMGGTAAEIPEVYRLLSPLYHVGAHCPPTLLLQGRDDVFQLTPGVRRLHESLRAAGVASALLEFPHTEHGFDLALPRISPAARAATCAVEEFLARLV
jgi:acetyl esterase/lipase